MATGKGHSKGFNHYMCKKFFHPGNPINMEKVFIARQNHAVAETEERDKLAEYQKEQEAYKARETMAIAKGKTQLSRDKLALSFMYEPPAGVRGSGVMVKENPCSISGNIKLKKKQDEDGLDEGDTFCYQCHTEGHTSKECPKDGEPAFAWQRNAPRESFLKNDPNVIDKPFGILVNYARCMRCNVLGHTHTEKHCPLFGKARDHEEPEELRPVDEKKLIAEMKDKDGLVFNSFGLWDNGKNSKGNLVRKHYELVYSSEEEGKDLLVSLVTKLKTKKKKRKKSSLSKKIKVKKEKSVKKDKKEKDLKREIITTDEESSSKKKRKSSKNVKSKKSSKRILEKVDKILAESEESKEVPEIKYTAETLAKIDDILFADIDKTKNEEQKKYLSEVDRILSLSTSESSSKDDETDVEKTESEEDTEEEEEEETEEELTEEEMRLLNLININKIDVKLNFPLDYPDTDCHFCRQAESSAHLAVCPVYDSIMRGTEFEDIKSQSLDRVKRGLANIRAALVQRSHALSFTSVGSISRRNMKLLTLRDETETSGTRERDRLVTEILEES